MTIGSAAQQLMRHGPLVRVDIHHHPAMRGHRLRTSPDLEHASDWFLVDTGSAMTMVEREIVDAIALAPTGATLDVASTGGFVRDCLVYHAELVLHLSGGQLALTTTIIGLPRSQHLPNSPHRGVIGRNLLHKAQFFYDGIAGTFDIRQPGK